MQDEDFSHSDLFRRACRAHERRLARRRRAGDRAPHTARPTRRPRARGLFDACIAAVPYAPAAAFLANEQAKLRSISTAAGRQRRRRRPRGRRPRWRSWPTGSARPTASPARSRRSASAASRASRSRWSAPIAEVDRRLAAVAEIDVPFYPGLRIGVPSLPGAVADARGRLLRRDPRLLAGARRDRRRARRARARAAAARQLPHRARRLRRAALRRGTARARRWRRGGALLQRLRPRALAERGLRRGAARRSASPRERVLRWDRGVDTGRFDPALRRGARDDGTIDVLYAGRITREKGVELLAEAFLAARAPRPAPAPRARRRRARAGAAGRAPRRSTPRFLGWLAGRRARAGLRDADIFLFPSATDTFGQVILEAQASGLPVVAVAEGGPLSLIEDGVDRPAAPGRAPTRWPRRCSSWPPRRCRAQALGAAAVRAARGRTWERTLERLADGLPPRARRRARHGTTRRRAA